MNILSLISNSSGLDVFQIPPQTQSRNPLAVMLKAIPSLTFKPILL
jgi:hypothetical protein